MRVICARVRVRLRLRVRVPEGLQCDIGERACHVVREGKSYFLSRLMFAVRLEALFRSFDPILIHAKPLPRLVAGTDSHGCQGTAAQWRRRWKRQAWAAMGLVGGKGLVAAVRHIDTDL